MKRLTIFFVLLMLVAGLIAACQPTSVPGTTEPPATTAPAGEKTARELQNGKPFIYVGNNLQHPTIKMMMLGFWDACKKYDVACKFIVAPGGDESGVVQSIDQAIAYGASGIDSTSYLQFTEANKKAWKAGIPVIGQHGNLADQPADFKNPDASGLIAWVGPDAILYGSQVAEMVADKTKCGSPVIVTQSSFNTTEDAANKGFHDKYAALCPKATILETQQEGLEPVAAIAKVSAILVANPKLKAAFGTTGGSINAWGKALQQAGYKPGDVLMIGMDGTKENIDMVRSGYAYALVNQPVYEDNYHIVELLIAHLKGEKVNFDNPMPSSIVTADGLDALESLAARSLTDLPNN